MEESVSNEFFSLALRCEVATTTQIAVLMVLADAADDDGVCWPSVEFLVSATRAGRSTVLRTLAELEQDGYLTRQRRRAKASVYKLNKDRLARRSRSGTSQKETSQPGTSRSENGKVPQRDRSKGTPQRTPTRRESEEEHPEARKLAERLVERMVDNGCRKPSITAEWLRDGRLLLTKDGRSFPEALAVLDWCQSDRFWRKNIRSLPKFRAQFDRLRMDAEEAGALTAKATAPSTPDAAADWLREQWRTADVSQIEQVTGLRYEVPDLPLEVTGRTEVDAWLREHRQQWITDNHALIITRLTERGAA